MGKKKKKKKKKHKRKRDQGAGIEEAAPPPRLGTQSTKASQLEPALGGKSLLSNADEVRGSMGTSHGGHQSLLGTFDANEGLSNVGRSRVKAGIRLEPITPSAVAAPLA